MYHCNDNELQIVHYINKLLGITNSCNSTIVNNDNLMYLYNQIEPIIDQIRTLFNIRSSKEYIGYKVAINHLKLIYERWCNCTFDYERHQKRVNGKRIETPLCIKRSSNLWAYIRKYK